jgi:hypothetical protein
MIVFHQYGARRTGTNYIQALLEENFKNILVLSSVFWKHDYAPSFERYKKRIFPNFPTLSPIIQDCFRLETQNPDFPKGMPPWRLKRKDLSTLFQEYVGAALSDNINTLITIKDPYAWIESMLRWVQTSGENSLQHKYIFLEPQSANLEQFKEPFRFAAKDNYKPFRQSIEMYNKRYEQWLSQATEVVKYESLLLQHEVILEKFQKTYELEPIYDYFVNIKSGCDPSPTNRSEPSRAWDYEDYYLNKRYLQNLPEEVIQIISTEVDWELFKQYGYAPI